jgi:Cytochrome P450
LFTHIDESAHAAERRLIANAYSLSSLLELERFVDDMIEEFAVRLRMFANSPTPINMGFWMQAFAFDVVGELAFGQAFGFLATGQDVHRQMANSKEWLRQRFAVAMVPSFFPIFRSALFGIFSSSGKEEKENENRRNAVICNYRVFLIYSSRKGQ